MLRILPTAKLPYNICKGSPEKRLSFAKQLNNDFFNKISRQFFTNEVKFDVFEKTLKDATPKNIIVNVKNYDKSGGLTVNTLNDAQNAVEGFIIYLNKCRYGNGIRLLETDISLHETFHYFSHLTNPKHIARTAKMHETGLGDRTENFYKKNLYSSNKFDSKELSSKLDDFLKQFTLPEQIEFLQNSRYRMTEEYHAYDEGYRYLDKIQDIHSDMISEKIYGTEKEDFNFPEKIKIVTDKLRDVINEYRKS